MGRNILCYLERMRKPVLGYEGRYEVSDAGEIISLLGLKERVLKPHSGATWMSRHCRVGLHDGGGRTTQKTRLVHQLVAEAFLPPKPFPEAEIRHKDGNHLNNRADNLEWGTKSENVLDQVRDGVHNNARKTHCKRGHEFTPENTIRRATGRQCRTCNLEYQRAWKEKQKAANG